MSSIYASTKGGLGGAEGAPNTGPPSANPSKSNHNLDNQGGDLHIYTPRESEDGDKTPLRDNYADTDQEDPYNMANDSSSSGMSSPATPPTKAEDNDLENLDSHFSILAGSPATSARGVENDGVRSHSSPKGFPSSPISPIAAQPISPPASPNGNSEPFSELRAGSMRGISLRAKMEYRSEGGSSWKSGFFTFNDITCSLLLHESPGKDPINVFEVSGCIEKRDRIFKRKNRFDVLCIGVGMLSLSAPTKEIKGQFVDKLVASCEPGNSNLMRQLRTEMAAESRKVIALASLSDEWKGKYERLKEEQEKEMSEEMTAVSRLALERFANLLGRRADGLVGRGFIILKRNVAATKADEDRRQMKITATLKGVIRTWSFKTVANHFVRWVRFTIGDHVKRKVSEFERFATLQYAKKQLGSSVALVLDIMGPIRKQEISLMEAELDALDSETALLGMEEEEEKAGQAPGEPGARMMEVILESYARAMNECDTLGAPISSGEDGKSFDGVGGEMSTPNIHLFSDDECDNDGEEESDNGESVNGKVNGEVNGDNDNKGGGDDSDDDVNLSFVPSQVRKIERRLSNSASVLKTPPPKTLNKF